MGKPIYEITFSFELTERSPNGVTKTSSFSMNLDGFEVIGGSTRFIMNDGRGAISEADLMSEFYQAEKFKKISVARPIDRDSFVMDKIYYLKLSFDFLLVVKSVARTSRFNSLMLYGKKTRLVKPPDRGALIERLYFNFTDPYISHSYYDFSNGKGTKVTESL